MVEEEEATKYRVFFVRTGQSDISNSRHLSGWCDAFLSQQGIQEAHEASQELINSGYNVFDVVFTSTLSRARKFAQILLKDLHLESITTYHSWRLNERHHGWLTGFKSKDTACKYGVEQSVHWYLSKGQIPKITKNHEYYANIAQTSKEYKIPEHRIPLSETIESCAKRILPYWDSFIGPMIRANKRVLIVVHEHAFRGFVKLLQNMNEREISLIRLPSATIPIYYDVNEDLVAFNEMTFICNNDKKQAWLASRWENRSRHIAELNLT